VNERETDAGGGEILATDFADFVLGIWVDLLSVVVWVGWELNYVVFF